MKIIKKILKPSSSYSLLDIKDVKIKQVLLFDIYIQRDKDYVIIIEAGTTIDDSLYAKLLKQDNLYITKKDTQKKELSPKTLKYHIKENRDDVEKRLELLYDANKQIFDLYENDKDNKINISNIELVISSIIFLIKYDNDFIKNTMPYFKNQYNVSNHSLHVGIYAIKLGTLLKFSTNKLQLLGLSALLHDIGYKKINIDILNKENKYNEKDIKEVSQHPRFGVEIAKHNNVNDTNVLDAIMHHHERYDGLGYPHKQNEKTIGEFASILAVCDVFDALTNNRPYREEYSSFEALKLMIKDPDMMNQFNTKYLHLALKSLKL